MVYNRCFPCAVRVYNLESDNAMRLLDIILTVMIILVMVKIMYGGTDD